MPQESPNNDTKKTKQRFNGRRRNYVDAFRWGFVPEEGSDRAASSNSVSAQSDHESNSKPSRPTQQSSSPPSAELNVPKRSRPRKKVTQPAAIPEAKAENTQKAKAQGNGIAKQSPHQKVQATSAPKGKRRKKSAIPQYTASAGYDENDEDLKLPSYGRTPTPTDDELPVSRKVARKPESKPKPQKSVADSPALAVGAGYSEVPVPGFHPRREQLVWDPEKSEYVPLIETPKSERSLPKKQPKISESPKQDLLRERTEKTEKKPAKVAKELRSNSHTSNSHITAVPSAPTLKPEIPKREKAHRVDDRHNSESQETTRRKGDSRRRSVEHFVEPPHLDPTDVEAEVSGFAELGVSEIMLEALKIVRYLAPTPIQAGVFQKVQAGVDLMGQAHTGTGKTAAFSMPIIEGVELCPPGNDPVALILVPTRELAVQVRDESIRLSYGRDLRIAACYGGKPLAKQIERLRTGVDILVGTPGRILDLMNRKALSLHALRWVVLDEADRMLDIGFRPDIEKILRQTPQDRQTLLFSATLPAPVVRLAERYMKSPEVLDFSNKGVAVDTIDQFYVTVDPDRKFDALVYLLEEQKPQQAIIFTRTKRGADRLARLLANRFEHLAAIHGDLAQSERDSVMAKVRAGSLQYLVATDVVGRGIDVSGISHIINYDVPKFCDDYVHRVGRTGRMGREGVAFTFVTSQEGSELTRIEMRIDKLLKRAELKGFESFTKPHDPNASLDEELPLEPAKPVFGKPVRKVRRAL